MYVLHIYTHIYVYIFTFIVILTSLYLETIGEVSEFGEVDLSTRSSSSYQKSISIMERDLGL